MNHPLFVKCIETVHQYGVKHVKKSYNPFTIDISEECCCGGILQIPADSKFDEMLLGRGTIWQPLCLETFSGAQLPVNCCSERILNFGECHIFANIVVEVGQAEMRIRPQSISFLVQKCPQSILNHVWSKWRTHLWVVVKYLQFSVQLSKFSKIGHVIFLKFYIRLTTSRYLMEKS